MTEKILTYRHSPATRITHWINTIALTILLMSGLQIYNAHPALYWGDISHFDSPLFKFGEGGDASFPAWATLPGYHDLAGGRLWHLFFAWVLVLNGTAYFIASAFRRHIGRDLIPTMTELRGIPHAVVEHIKLRFPKGEEARRYNVLQQLTYLAVLFVLLPLVIATGMAMSPRLNAALPWLPELFGGRQSARTVHFMAASGLLAFTIVHVALVFLSGVFNNMRSMITGRYAIEKGDGDAAASAR